MNPEELTMNPFERLAKLLSEHPDPIRQEAQWDDARGRYTVSLNATVDPKASGWTWAKGEGSDLEEALGNAFDVWDKLFGGNPFARARALMAKTLKDDQGLAQGYEANVAMLLHDRFDGADFKDKEVREDAAIQILELIFQS